MNGIAREDIIYVNKVEFIYNCFLSFIKQYIFKMIVKKLLEVGALSY